MFRGRESEESKLISVKTSFVIDLLLKHCGIVRGGIDSSYNPKLNETSERHTHNTKHLVTRNKINKKNKMSIMNLRIACDIMNVDLLTVPFTHY